MGNYKAVGPSHDHTGRGAAVRVTGFVLVVGIEHYQPFAEFAHLKLAAGCQRWFQNSGLHLSLQATDCLDGGLQQLATAMLSRQNTRLGPNCFLEQLSYPEAPASATISGRWFEEWLLAAAAAQMRTHYWHLAETVAAGTALVFGLRRSHCFGHSAAE